MSRLLRYGVVAAVLASGVAAVASRERAPEPPAPVAASTGPVPRLLDLGADSCVPCKAMAPILVRLRAEYAGRMEVVFIDVWRDRGAADSHGIRLIPTQIFFGADGKELARHEGFMGKEEILAQWKRLGITFPEP